MLRTRSTLCLALLALACRSHARPDSQGLAGKLSASWAGADTGKLSAPVRAAWCDDQRRLELTAVQGDAGIGLLIYPVNQLRPGNYRAVVPGTDSLTRPAVSAAGRWFTEKLIAAYQSDSGDLELTGTPQSLGATFDIHMRSVDGQDTVRLTGRFSGVRPGACAADSLADSVSAPADSE